MPTTARRAPSFRLIDHGFGHVVLYDRHPEFGPATRTFLSCADGYVRTDAWRQVCEQLSDRGVTLRATHDRLAAVIRREVRRRNVAWAREQRD